MRPMIQFFRRRVVCALLAAVLLAAAVLGLRAARRAPGAEAGAVSAARSAPVTALALGGAAAPAQPALRTLAASSLAALEDDMAQARYTLTVDRYADARLEAFTVEGWQGSMAAVRYESSDERVCTVDQTGLVTGVGPGSAVITATAADGAGASVSARCDVTVNDADPPITALTLVRSKATLRMGGTGSDLTVTGCEPAVYFDLLETPVYTSSDESVCTVDAAGHITAVAPGQAVVTVSLYGVSAQCAVTVKDVEVRLSGGVELLPFSAADLLAIGNQTAGKCSWYALRYARTILDGQICSGAGMWNGGVIWSAGGYTDYSAGLADCLNRLYSELNAGRPVIVHLQNTHVAGAAKHADRISTYEYQSNGAGGWSIVEYPHIATSSYYGHWVCVVGYAADADPANLKESDFFALDPARISVNGALTLTRLLDGTIWTANSPLKVAR